jgi:hypothetical protein
MTNRLNLLASLCCLSVVAGCATGPDFKTYSSNVPPPKEGESRVWFYRPSKMLGSAVQPIVYINDTPIAKAQPGSFFYADKGPGTYELRCTTEWADKAVLTVIQNQVCYVRLSLLPGLFVGHVLPKVVPEKDALSEIQNCRLITADGMNQNWHPAETPKTPSGTP